MTPANAKAKTRNPQLVLIIGAGGHGQVVADILLRMQEAGEPCRPIGFMDDDATLVGKAIMGLPVLGAIECLGEVSHDAAMVAVGDNRTRARLFAELGSRGQRFSVARHPKTVIAPDVQIGEGSMICAGVIINTQALIGRNVILNTACSVDHHNRIGDHAHLGPGVHLGGEVEIGAGALIGIGATVMPRRKVGAWSVVGAGALVCDDVPEGVVVVGTPARIVRKLES